MPSGSSARHCEIMEIPSPFQATILSYTSAFLELEIRMPDSYVHPRALVPQLFSQTRFSNILAPSEISKKIPTPALLATEFFPIVTSVQSISHHIPGPLFM